MCLPQQWHFTAICFCVLLRCKFSVVGIALKQLWNLQLKPADRVGLDELCFEMRASGELFADYEVTPGDSRVARLALTRVGRLPGTESLMCVCVCVCVCVCERGREREREREIERRQRGETGGK
jgi:hypothetical protein